MLNILTLNWDGQSKLEKLYPSLLKNLDNLDWKWFIKDNNSQDNSVQTIESWNNPNVILCKYQNNLQNYSEGNNYLFNIASPKDSDYILLLNNDIIFNDTVSLKNMISIINKDQNVGAVGARLLYTETNQLQHGGVVMGERYKLPMNFRSKQKSDANAEKNREFQGITGALLLTKSEYYKNANQNIKTHTPGLDQNLAWAFDDIDLCLSIKYNFNKKIVYCGKTNVYHEESPSLKKNPSHKLFLKNNIIYFANKWYRRYIIDQSFYTNDPKYNLYTAPNG